MIMLKIWGRLESWGVTTKSDLNNPLINMVFVTSEEANATHIVYLFGSNAAQQKTFQIKSRILLHSQLWLKC